MNSTHERTIVKPLGDDVQNRLRFRLWTESGQVTAFTVQFEAAIAGTFVLAMRYDTARRFVHRDRLHCRGGAVAKDPLAPDVPLKEALAREPGRHLAQRGPGLGADG